MPAGDGFGVSEALADTDESGAPTQIVSRVRVLVQ